MTRTAKNAAARNEAAAPAFIGPVAPVTEAPAAEAPAAEAPAAPAFGKVIFGRKMAANRLFADSRVIRLNPEIMDDKGAVRLNPKRGKAAARFARYVDGMTVAAYIAATVEGGEKPGVATADLKFDTERAFIIVEG